ncbi:hypothetical protein [Ancylomarina sp.]|uniref:hypothetical protein n=1 Tax=Ancylomarina sp. TaxID=1970196 RepID=UPI003568E4C7
MKKLLLILLLGCLMTFCTEKSGNVSPNGNGNGNGNGDTDIIPTPVHPEIFDVQNLGSKSIIAIDNPDSIVFIPMDLTSVSNPVEGVPSSPVHTTMDFGVYIQQEAAEVKDKSNNN